ncbi:MAG: polysaccharide biosynthesis protein [bacterium]|nr:polysaccharide biosynthesis protein [bacterium]
MKKTFAHNAIILCLLLFISKALGAFFRLPLTWIVGAEGLGLYQIVFPIYSLVLTLTSSFIPQALAKIVSAKRANGNFEGARQVYLTSLVMVGAVSFVFFAIIFLTAPLISAFQGNPEAKLCYYAISPSVFFVGLISVFKGYFQGCQNIIPTGVISLIEQIVKAVFGLVLAYVLLPYGLVYGVCGALIGITISEFVSLIYSFIHFKIIIKKEVVSGERAKPKSCIMQIIKTCLPLFLGDLVLPIVGVIDSNLIINLLSRANETSLSTAYFGLSSGVVGSLINLPIVFSLGISTVVLPKISALKESCNEKLLKKTYNASITLVLLMLLPCAGGLFILAKPIINLLYGQTLSSDFIELSARLLMVGSISVVFFGLYQVFASFLQGTGNFKTPLISLIFGGAVKILLNILLIPQIGIIGDQIASICCFFTCFVINFAFTAKYLTAQTLVNVLKLIISAGVMIGIIYLFYYKLSSFNTVRLVFAIILAVMVYVLITGLLFIKTLLKNRKSVAKIIKNH